METGQYFLTIDYWMSLSPALGVGIREPELYPGIGMFHTVLELANLRMDIF
jgi:hypothetical protein